MLALAEVPRAIAGPYRETSTMRKRYASSISGGDFTMHNGGGKTPSMNMQYVHRHGAHVDKTEPLSVHIVAHQWKENKFHEHWNNGQAMFRLNEGCQNLIGGDRSVQTHFIGSEVTPVLLVSLPQLMALLEKWNNMAHAPFQSTNPWKDAMQTPHKASKLFSFLGFVSSSSDNLDGTCCVDMQVDNNIQCYSYWGETDISVGTHVGFVLRRRSANAHLTLEQWHSMQRCSPSTEDLKSHKLSSSDVDGGVFIPVGTITSTSALSILKHGGIAQPLYAKDQTPLEWRMGVYNGTADPERAANVARHATCITIYVQSAPPEHILKNEQHNVKASENLATSNNTQQEQEQEKGKQEQEQEQEQSDKSTTNSPYYTPVNVNKSQSKSQRRPTTVPFAQAPLPTGVPGGPNMTPVLQKPTSKRTNQNA